MTRVEKLTAQIMAVCPIAGVSVGRWDDKTSWRIDYAPTATAADKAAADAVVQAFDLTAEIKAELQARVDETAEGLRLKFITPGGAQAMIYREKYEEAKRCLADASSPVDPSNYPLLNAEISLRGPTVTDVARAVVAQATQWILIAASIEGIRQRAKADIAAAADETAAQAAYDAVDWSAIPAP